VQIGVVVGRLGVGFVPGHGYHEQRHGLRAGRREIGLLTILNMIGFDLVDGVNEGWIIGHAGSWGALAEFLGWQRHFDRGGEESTTIPSSAIQRGCPRLEWTRRRLRGEGHRRHGGCETLASWLWRGCGAVAIEDEFGSVEINSRVDSSLLEECLDAHNSSRSPSAVILVHSNVTCSTR
jgi:hypothetical protein